LCYIYCFLFFIGKIAEVRTKSIGKSDKKQNMKPNGKKGKIHGVEKREKRKRK
jgi:hypothetical protein